MSKRQELFLKKYRHKQVFIKFVQIFLAVFILGIWELLARLGLIDTFITSEPSKIFLTIINLFKEGNLLEHIWVTLSETLIAFFITGIVSVFVSILLYRSETLSRIVDPYLNTNKSRIKILKTFGANEWEILRYAVIPSNYKLIVNACKINIGLCLIGIVMGEFLTSKAGIGYLILYGSQVFNLDLVMSGIVILLVMSILLYSIISSIEKHLDC